MKKRLYLLLAVCCLTFLTFTGCKTDDGTNNSSTTDKIGTDVKDDINGIDNNIKDNITDVPGTGDITTVPGTNKITTVPGTGTTTPVK